MLEQSVKETLFTTARSFNSWLDKPVPERVLHEAYDLAKMAPTSANCSPMRVLFLRTNAAKQRLKPLLAQGNVEKTMTAPVTAILAHDMSFYQYLPKLFPHADAKSWFEGNDTLIAQTAFRNGTLQMGYLILALRGVGLDCGPLSGFDAHGVDKEFLSDCPFKSNFLLNIGYGDKTGLHPRSPRFEFDEVCSIL